MENQSLYIFSASVEAALQMCFTSFSNVYCAIKQDIFFLFCSEGRKTLERWYSFSRHESRGDSQVEQQHSSCYHGEAAEGWIEIYDAEENDSSGSCVHPIQPITVQILLILPLLNWGNLRVALDRPSVLSGRGIWRWGWLLGWSMWVSPRLTDRKRCENVRLGPAS